MARPAVLAIRIVSDAADAQKAFQGTEKAQGRWERGLGTASRAAAVAGAAIVALGVKTAAAASTAQQAAGAVEAAFGRQADAVDRLAAGAADRVGLATSQYGQLAAVLGSQLRNLGVSEDQLVGTTDDLITRGADLAATFGGTTAEAVDALSSLMRGERDPIERYGVSIKDADIQARLAADGLDKLTGDARRQAETQATLAILTEQTANAQGQFARESDTAAGAQQRAAANAENAAAAIGQALLPVVVLAASALGQLAQFATENAGAFRVVVVAVAALAGAILAINGITKVYTAAHRALSVVLRVGAADTIRHRVATIASTAVATVARGATLAWAAAQRVLNLAMRANPIGIVVTIIAALVGAIIAAYKNSETFRSIVQKAGAVAKSAFDAVVRAVRPVVDFVGRLIDGVRSVVGWISRIKFPKPPAWLSSIGSAIGDLFGASQFAGPYEPGLVGATAPRLGGPTSQALPRLGFMPHLGGGSTGLAALAALSGGGLTVVTVNGALDPDAVARQIERILARRATRTGRGVVTRQVVL